MPPPRGGSGKPSAAMGRGRSGPGAKGKSEADEQQEAAAAAAQAAAAARLARLRLIVFSALGVAMLGTLGTASWVMFFKEPEHPLVDIPPPEPAPPRPTGPVIRQGDLSDELWRRMGVRPQGE
ncbi:MAG: hypothetical protein HY059_04750 [Proteobacteria bacterium]|nr:hypothetical protein [Pseudomonadota bacterium]